MGLAFLLYYNFFNCTKGQKDDDKFQMGCRVADNKSLTQPSQHYYNRHCCKDTCAVLHDFPVSLISQQH